MKHESLFQYKSQKMGTSPQDSTKTHRIITGRVTSLDQTKEQIDKIKQPPLINMKYFLYSMEQI